MSKIAIRRRYIVGKLLQRAGYNRQNMLLQWACKENRNTATVRAGNQSKTNRYRGGQIVLDLDGREVRVDTVTITDLIVNLGRVAAVRNGG